MLAPTNEKVKVENSNEVVKMFCIMHSVHSSNLLMHHTYTVQPMEYEKVVRCWILMDGRMMTI